MYPISLLNEESVDTAGKFPTDTDFSCFSLSLQDQRLFMHDYNSQAGENTDSQKNDDKSP